MSRIVDLTLPITTGMAGIPTISFYAKHPVRVQTVTVVDEKQRAKLFAEQLDVDPLAPSMGHMNTVLTLNTHIGTHVDAPRHFLSDGISIDQLPLDRLVMREAVVLDVSYKGAGEGVSGQDLERTGVKPTPGQVAVIKTLWTDRTWGKPEFWENTIYLQPSVSEWLEPFGVAAVAMDCFPEYPFWKMTVAPADRGANHKRWLNGGIPMIQMLTGLREIGPRFDLTALPLRLAGADGCPARVIGIEN